MTPDEDPGQRFGWLLSESARAVLINVPLVLMLASAEYNSWLFQERPRQPDPANGLVQVLDHKGIKVYLTSTEAWLSQGLSSLGWIAVAISLAAFLLRHLLKPGTPIIRLPEEGIPHPAEFIATLVVLATIAVGVFARKF